MKNRKMLKSEIIKQIIRARRKLPSSTELYKLETEEGGCGVIGFACNIPVSGRHIFYPSIQMHNRGNGKGGGIAAVGLSPKALGVTQEILENDYLYQIALLDPSVQTQLEEKFIKPFFQIDKAEKVKTIGDYRDLPGLEIKPPDVIRYFVRVKPEVLKAFIEQNGLERLDPRRAEDEFVYQNTYKINHNFYSALGEKKAFVLSHGRNMCIFKIVGYAEQVVQYYQLEDFKAYVWIAHQRYPTKGKVWHPAGAHPFAGMHEALVHNGDFANYYSVAQYLRQHNIFPLFLTDTEVSILIFDLLNRVYGYPLECIIEAMAPTTELDFELLPQTKQKIYRAIHTSHIHGSPDGPWFFIIARNEPYENYYQLIGITDTAMLRPQVFALYDGGEVQIGLIASEKQAIDATLRSLSEEDKRFCPVADKYWNARGGSHTDGGAFIFTVRPQGERPEAREIICTDKFGKVMSVSKEQQPWSSNVSLETATKQPSVGENILNYVGNTSPLAAFEKFVVEIPELDYETFYRICDNLAEKAIASEENKEWGIEFLTLLNDRRYPTGTKKRSWLLWIVNKALNKIFDAVPPITTEQPGRHKRIDWQTRKALRPPAKGEEVLVVNAWDFPPEGDECDAKLICEAYFKGWRRFIAYGYRGQRFCGCGLGPKTQGVRIDVYGSSGDYLGSGIDGLEIYVHGNAQDQLGQIANAGKIVIYGDVGQTFLYGAKGGEMYVLGNAAGRPLINAVGAPRVVINGTALDYLAESFMAGDPLNGGGFVILNGMEYDEKGNLREQPTPYPGSNLFSLASGGAIYVRDPHRKLVKEQLNGGEFASLTQADWELILPYLEENERLFGIKINDLLTVNGELRKPEEVYRKVRAIKLKVLAGSVPEWE
ncbi:MAG: glutamate synthase [Candidatus Desulfofervidaceae bacterium]|nr:glutamate synthase [Candidatus Desulfofervidaceae bacterium]